MSISGYHIREAGSTAVQELAFTLADGMAYVEASIKAGLNLLGLQVGAPRLPYVELDERERETVRSMLERHGLLHEVTAR